ncbi:MAG: hypothetical protein M3Z84_02935 [Actinomycetota bacterium]|nr:hypothetical protein [Actinomycetota bacterium]
MAETPQRDEPKQITPAGQEIPIPEREDFDRMVSEVVGGLKAPEPSSEGEAARAPQASRKRPAETSPPHERRE